MVALTAPLSPDEHPHLYARHVQGCVHGPDVLRMLRYLRRKEGRPLIIIWDRLQAHRAREVSNYVRAHRRDFRLEWLPPYAPDLNPEEQCNAVVKKAMANATPDSIATMRAMARTSFRHLQRRPEYPRLRAFY